MVPGMGFSDSLNKLIGSPCGKLQIEIYTEKTSAACTIKVFTIVIYSSVCSVSYNDPMIVIYSPSKGLESYDRSFIV